MLDLRIDFQRLRHSRPAELARRALYRWMAGADGWPVVFRRPGPGEEVPPGASPHLYVHLPFCRELCPHCPYNKTLYEARQHEAYGRALRRELEGWIARAGTHRARSLYFGGGTPSATPDLVELAIDLVRPRLEPDAEIGVEVHPRDATPPLLDRLRRAGVNRVSLGVETLRPDLLKLLGRSYDPAQALDSLRAARAARFPFVDANLIYGIPGQSDGDPASDAEVLLGEGVGQISAYPLFTFLHTPYGRRVAEHRFPIIGDRLRVRSQRLLSRVCREGGLERTSVWSFTRRGAAPYSTVTHEDYVGFGAGAGSKVGGVFWFNTFSVPAYVESRVHRPALRMEAGDRLRRAHWLYWRIYRLEIDGGDYHALFGRELEDDYGAFLRLLRLSGMARRTPPRWRLTERGAVWVHRLQCLFSLTWIDRLWTRCRDEPWPEEVVLA
jgi:oxygen-independent coproporphyrinogen-3 oxidase